MSMWGSKPDFAGLQADPGNGFWQVGCLSLCSLNATSLICNRVERDCIPERPALEVCKQPQRQDQCRDSQEIFAGGVRLAPESSFLCSADELALTVHLAFSGDSWTGLVTYDALTVTRSTGVVQHVLAWQIRQYSDKDLLGPTIVNTTWPRLSKEGSNLNLIVNSSPARSTWETTWLRHPCDEVFAAFGGIIDIIAMKSLKRRGQALGNEVFIRGMINASAFDSHIFLLGQNTSQDYNMEYGSPVSFQAWIIFKEARASHLRALLIEFVWIWHVVWPSASFHRLHACLIRW